MDNGNMCQDKQVAATSFGCTVQHQTLVRSIPRSPLQWLPLGFNSLHNQAAICSSPYPQPSSCNHTLTQGLNANLHNDFFFKRKAQRGQATSLRSHRSQ